MANIDDYQSVIIIGAACSGGTLLRDMLAQQPGVGTFPCDEINYIWRHHNVRVPHDEFEPAHARDEVHGYVQSAFARQAHRGNLQYIVEKTCANSLRVNFVDKVIPNAKYLYLVRNGYDVATSAMKRWRSRSGWRQTLRNIRGMPVSDMPYYARRYLGRGPRVWGPRMKDLEALLAERPLVEVCALQWARCIERSEEAFAELPLRQIHRLSYEDLVTHPRAQMQSVLKFLEIIASDEQIEEMAKRISFSHVGTGRQACTLESLERLEAIIEPTLAELGYLSEPRTYTGIAA